MMHTYLATAKARRWLARNQPKKEVGRGDKLVFLTAILMLVLLLMGIL